MRFKTKLFTWIKKKKKLQSKREGLQLRTAKRNPTDV